MNRTVTLVRVANIPAVGIVRGPIAKHANGRVSPTAMLYKGQSHDCPDSYYAIKYYVGRQPNVGRDLQQAEARLRDFRKRLEADTIFYQMAIKGAPFYNASAFRPNGRDLVDFFKNT